MAAGVECFRVQFPRGMDANEYARKVTPAAKSLAVAIRKAEWMGQGRAPDRSDAGPIVERAAPPAIPVPVAAERAPVVAYDPDAAAAGLEILAILDAEARDRAAMGHQPDSDPIWTIPDPEPAPSVATAVPPAPPTAPVSVSPAAQAVVATPCPEVPSVGAPVERLGQDTCVVLGDRRYRVRGLGKAPGRDQLKVNLYVTRGESFHVDSLDLYSSRQRALFTKEAALELGLDGEVVKRDLGRVLLALEEIQEEEAKAAAQPKSGAPSMSPGHRDEAMELLQDPRLMDRILEDFLLCGVVGEEINKLVGYLAMVSRLLEAPLAVVIRVRQRPEVVVDGGDLCVSPGEHGVDSAMTGQSLFYMGEADLKHKVLCRRGRRGASDLRAQVASERAVDARRRGRIRQRADT